MLDVRGEREGGRYFVTIYLRKNFQSNVTLTRVLQGEGGGLEGVKQMVGLLRPPWYPASSPGALEWTETTGPARCPAPASPLSWARLCADSAVEGSPGLPTDLLAVRGERKKERSFRSSLSSSLPLFFSPSDQCGQEIGLSRRSRVVIVGS